MDSRVICKVMLCSYQELENRCESIDRAIYNTAIRSAFRDTMEAYAEIERLTREKIAYINVKVIIDQALGTLYRKYELEQYHIKGVKQTKLVEVLGISEGAIQSRVAHQRQKLYDAILSVHKGQELLNIICDSSWLMNRYKRELKQQNAMGNKKV